jgi:hypothetical protein
MLAGSHAGQELNYLLSVGSEGAASAISSDSQSGNRRPVTDVPDGLFANKSAAALQADSHMKHVDVYVKPSSVIIFAAFKLNHNCNRVSVYFLPQVHLGQRSKRRPGQVASPFHGFAPSSLSAVTAFLQIF